MDLPLMVSPANLARLRDELTGASRRIGHVSGQAGQQAIPGPWQGGAQHAFASASRTVGAQCLELSERLAAIAARVERLEEQLAEELAVLDHIEHGVLGALHRLAAAAVTDATGEARRIYDRVSQRLPMRGSPHWHELAHLIGGGWL